jgi:hypothetical protein
MYDSDSNNINSDNFDSYSFAEFYEKYIIPEIKDIIPYIKGTGEYKVGYVEWSDGVPVNFIPAYPVPANVPANYIPVNVNFPSK